MSKMYFIIAIVLNPLLIHSFCHYFNTECSKNAREQVQAAEVANPK